MTGKLTIKIDAGRELVLEQALCMGNQGYRTNALILLGVLALSESMNIDEFSYYVGLMEGDLK